MPIKPGKSKKVISGNIKEIVGGYKTSGRIGTSKPDSKAAAVKQAVAISLDKAGVQKKAKGGEMRSVSAKGSQASAAMVASQENKIKKRGGRVSFRRDGNLPVGNY